SYAGKIHAARTYGPPGRARLLLFSHYFDRAHGRVSRDRHKFQQQLALRIRLQAFDLPHQRTILSNFVNDLHVAEDRFAIAENVESALFDISTLHLSSFGRFMCDEVQSHAVLARSDRNRIGEVSTALAL